MTTDERVRQHAFIRLSETDLDSERAVFWLKVIEGTYRREGHAI